MIHLMNPQMTREEWEERYRNFRSSQFPGAIEICRETDLLEYKTTQLCTILGEHQGTPICEESGDAESGPMVWFYWACCGQVEGKWF